MLSAADIRNVTFTTSGRDKYKSGEVDMFLDQCAETVASLTKSRDSLAQMNAELSAQKAELEKKLDVLADKLVEYRDDEDSIRSALLNAQRLGDTIVREANHKATLILDDATIKADKILSNAKREVVDDQKELLRVQSEVNNFKAQMLSIYREHLAIIGLMPETEITEETDIPVRQPEQMPAEPEPVIEPEAVQEEPQEQQSPQEAASGETQTNRQETVVEVVSETVFTSDPQFRQDTAAAGQAETIKNVSRFGNLKFGEDYDISRDDEDEDDDLDREQRYYKKRK